MNHIYRVVYNTASQTYQAVPEISKGKHKSCAEKTSAAASKTPTFAGKLRALCAALLALTCPFALAAPTGGAVSAGQAAIHQAGNITDIRQSSQNAAINWQNFSIGAHETVNFHQPNAQSLTLNRVIGNERSIIDGAMNANGKVFISNPNGMLIGRDAQINVGSLVATTAQISNDDFMNGRYQFTNAKGEIENLGNITVPQGGVVALIAPIVKHSGTITAPKAHTLLASADSFSITLPDNANFAYTLDKGTLQGLVDNGGAILADGGRVVLTAKGVDSVKKSLIKHTGVIEANTVQNKNGVIELLGDLDNSALNVSGSLKAEGKESGDGGFIETSAASLFFADSAHISTQAQNGQTGTWLIDPKDFTVAKSGGDMTATQVENALKSNNIALHTIRNTQGKNDGKGDIKINDAISWNANTLTLNAENDIHINANLNGSGTAKLALEYGQGTDNGGESDYHIKRGVKVNLPMGNTLTTQKGKNGEKIEFTVIHQMPDIIKNADGDWESKFTTQNIAFGADIDVSHTKNHEGFAGWRLSDDNQDITVAGLGHKADGLYLRSKKDSQYTGLFNVLYHVNRKNYRDVGVTNADVASEGRHAYAGALVGIGGNIKNSYATGRVATSGYEAYVGGLVGKIDYGNKLDDSYTNVSVSSTGENAHTGGLVGDGSNISNSYATGDVSSQGRGVDAGGLVGFGYDISNSYATGNVSSQGYGTETGGLVGNGKDISNSYAIGNVSSQGYAAGAGGLVGIGENISNSYATGNVSSQGDRADTGGLAGHGHNISNSYATGDVSSAGVNAHAGGLAGFGYDISNSYATGDVSSQEHDANAGGLVGSGYHISNSYATGDVSSQGRDADAGGLVGNGSSISNSYANNTSIKATGKDSAMGGLIGNYDYNARHDTGSKDSFFNQDKHPTLPAIGKYGYHVDKSKIVNVTGKTEAELKQKSTFTGWDFDTVWRIDEGNDTPRLRALTEGVITVAPNPNLPDVNIKAVELRKTYDGIAVNTIDDLKKLRGWNGYGGRLDGILVQGLKDGDKPADVFTGSVNFDGARSNWKGAVDAGEYILDPSGLGSQKYEIVWKTGNLTIDPAKVILTGRKLADGTANVNASNVVSVQGLKDRDLFQGSVFVSSGSGTLTGSQLNLRTPYGLKNMGTLTLSGTRAGNYVLDEAGKHSFLIVNQKYLDNLKNPNNPGTVTPTKPPVQPKPPATPTQPPKVTPPTTPSKPTTPAKPPATQPVAPNPTQPVQPTNPTQPTTPVKPTTPPTQPTQPSQPTPVQPTIPNQQAQDETQIGVDKEKPKTPKFPDFRDILPCKSAKECANKGIEWWKGEKGNYDTRIGQLLAEDRREEVFYLENPSIKPEDLDNYLKKLDGYSMSSQVIAEEYLSEFPKDLKIFDATFGYKTTFYYYLSSVIQMNELSNLSNVYNKELEGFANRHISTDSTTGRKVSEHIERMNWHFDQIDGVSTYNRRTLWGWEGTFMDSVHMMSDVLDFGVNAGKLVFAEAAVAMDVSLDVIEKTKNSFTTAVNVTNNTFTTKDIVTDALDIYTELKKGEDLDLTEVRVKMMNIAFNLEDVLGNGNLGSLKALTDLKNSIENMAKLEKAIDIVNKTPESALPKSIKEQVLDLLESKLSQATTDGAIAVFDYVGDLPALKSNKVVSILKNGVKALTSIKTGFNNNEYRAKSIAYGSKIKSMNSINKHLSNSLRERSRAIKATLR